ncbi:MAG: SDR family NAD(P)-dependent oxidoreductase [Pseudomonadales bacterium]
MSDPVCLVTGVGPGTGVAICRRFADGGYRVAMLARRLERLRSFETDIDGATAYEADVTDRDRLEEVLDRVHEELGTPTVIVHNAVRGTFGNVMEIEASDLEQNFRVNVLGLLHLTQLGVPAMIDGDGGAIIVTGNTSARRGRGNFAGFAPTKAAQRILAESMARHLGPQGIHVAYLIIDAVIGSPRTRERMSERDETFFTKPSAIADTVWQLAHQDSSGWSFEVDLRPFTEQW